MTTGSNGDDTIPGGNGADTLAGAGGNDSISGGGGNDTISGDFLTPTLINGDFSDGVTGWTGTGLEWGPEGTYLGNGSTNTVVEMDGAAGETTLIQQSFNVADPGVARLSFDAVTRSSGAVGVDGFTVQILNPAGAVIASATIIPNSNTTWATYTLDVAFPVGGSYTVRFTEVGDNNSQGALLDNVQFVAATGNDTIDGGAGDDVIDGGAGNDSLIGGDGGDVIYGGAGNDTIVGGGGNDVAFGGAGADTLDGGAGNDTLHGGAGNDSLTGGDGDDRIYGDSRTPAPVTVVNGDFATGTTAGWTVTGAGTFVDNQALAFNAGNNGVGGTAQQTIATEVGFQYLLSFTTFENGNGSATHTIVVDVLDANGRVLATRTVQVTNGSSQVVDIGFTASTTATTLRFSNPTSTGTSSTDVLIDDVTVTPLATPTTTGNDTINAGEGSDFVDAGGGDDLVTVDGTFTGNDTLYGGAGNDTLALLPGDNRDLTVDMVSGIVADGQPGAQEFANFENLITGGGNDSVTGSADSNLIITQAGNDTIRGGGGNDTLDGGAGADQLFGDEGNDLLFGGADDDSLWGGTGNDTIFFGAGNDTAFGGDGDDLFDDAPGAPSGTGNNLIYGGAGNDFSWDGSGNDTFYGGDGNDTFVGDNAGDDLLYGEAGNDSLSGGAGRDTLFGGDGNDRLDGGEGDDSLTGGAGSDLAFGGDGNDVINTRMTFGLGSPDRGYPGAFPADSNPFNDRDTVYGGAGDDTVLAGDDNDLIFGGEGNDSLDAGFDDDTVHADAGNDTVIGGEGRDLIYGGDGNDLLYGDAFVGHPEYSELTDADGSDLRADNNLDTVYGGAGNDIIFGGDDDDALYGGDGDDLIFGGVDNDSLYGDAGNDILLGGQGNDQLFGGDGVDVLDGEAGNDLLDGGAGDDAIFVGSGDTAFGGAGNDRFIITPDMLNGEALFIDGGEDDETTGDTLEITGPARIDYDPDNSENGTVTWLDGTVLTFQNIENITYVPCFTAATLIKTRRGEVPAGQLRPGDMVLTRNDGYQPIRWIGTRQLERAQLGANPSLNPVLIRAGALGEKTPERDLLVSPQHRILIGGPRVELWFGEDEVFVAAIHLTCLDDVDQIAPDQVTYVHIMFDRHQIISGDGAWSESYQPGDLTLRDMDYDQRAELYAVFPDLFDGRPGKDYPAARLTLNRHEVPLLFA